MGAKAIENITELQPGTQFGNYRIERKLGAGSMGVVYAAKDLNLNDRIVALKILPPESIKDQKLLGRFKREATAVVRFSHPHLIQGYEWGEFQKIHYFAMEYLEGESLKQILRNTRRFKPEEALKVVEQIASALKYAGEMGMIHRDIKPENIMITKEGVAKLCDLGLVKSSDDALQNRLTVIGTVLGTPNYMSPEQASGEEVDIRTDVYSLGVTFFQMLTGTTPFSGKTAAEILAKHIREEPPLLSDLIPEIDIRYVHILDNMLAKKTENRYSPEELFDDVIRLRQDHDTKKRSPRVTRSLEQLKGSTSRYRLASVCSKEDIFFGRTLTKNKAITFSKLRECLDHQEQMARANVEVSLEEIFQEKGYITAEQRRMVRQILDRHLQKEGDFLFARVALDEGFLSESQFQEFLKYHQEHLQKEAPLRTADFLLQKNLLPPKTIEAINHLVQVKRGAREDNAFADLTFKAQFLTDGQIRKCFKIQSNNIALYKYRPIKEVMIDKEFLSSENAQVISRALNRSSLTYESPIKLIQQLRLEEEDSLPQEDSFGWDSMLKEQNTAIN
ncbi:MAG: serine/threonine-protein kinase, partial [Planctomycetota bacterium]